MIGKKAGFLRSIGIALCLGALVSSSGLAQGKGKKHDKLETYEISDSDFQLDPGETKYLPMTGWRYVKKLFIRAEGATNIDGTFEVIANGDTKGTVYVPGKDPSYIVTIGEVVRSIELRHVSGGAVRVHNIKGAMSRRIQNFRPIDDEFFDEDDSICCGNTVDTVDDFPTSNLSSKLARKAIELIDKLEGFASYEEYGQYLLPIKKAAGRAYANATARGDLSIVTRRSLLVLKRQIEFACPYLEEAFERDHVFNLSVELMSLGERIDDLLD